MFARKAREVLMTPEIATLAHTARSTSACTERLARFFPDAKPVQIRALLTPLRSGAKQVRESVLLEFASAAGAIFSSGLPLEFDDRVRLRHVEGNAECEAIVVAVQYQDGRKAVAVQFAGEQRLWVQRP